MSEPCRRWWIRHADGSLFLHELYPPATLAEVRGWYPGALSIEPDTGPEPAPAAHHGLVNPEPNPTTPTGADAPGAQPC